MSLQETINSYVFVHERKNVIRGKCLPLAVSSRTTRIRKCETLMLQIINFYLRMTFVLKFMSSKLALKPESTFHLINTSFRIQLYEEALGDR